MPKDKTGTYAKILRAAEQEFLSKEYEKASMRSIAGQVGITAAGLYRHFPDKQAIFAHFVEPALQELFGLLDQGTKASRERLEQGQHESTEFWSFSKAEYSAAISLIYRNFTAIRLLLCSAAGSGYEDFQHRLVTREVRSTLEFHRSLQAAGVPVKPVSEKVLHLLFSGLISMVCEFIVHDYSEPEAMSTWRCSPSSSTPASRKCWGFNRCEDTGGHNYIKLTADYWPSAPEFISSRASLSSTSNSVLSKYCWFFGIIINSSGFLRKNALAISFSSFSIGQRPVSAKIITSYASRGDLKAFFIFSLEMAYDTVWSKGPIGHDISSFSPSSIMINPLRDEFFSLRNSIQLSFDKNQITPNDTIAHEC